MQLSKIAVPRTLFGKVALYGAILLLLAAALTGFFLVINFLVDLVSLGPRDLVAPNTSTEDNISVPSGIEVVVFAVSTLSIILGTTMLIVLRRWKLSRPFIRSSGTLLVGVLIAGLIVGAGLFLSFSGVLGEGISYAQHEAQRSYIDPAGIAVLGLIFLSIVFVGIIMPRLLLPLLAVFLLAGFGFGLLEPKGLEGLHLFNRPSHLEKPLAYAITVEEYRRGLDTSDAEIDADSSIETDKIETALVGPGKTRELAPVQPLPYGTVVSLDSIISAEQMHQPEDLPVFRVIGAAHTKYLRTGTGDVYQNGEWNQIDLFNLSLDADADFLEADTGTLVGYYGERGTDSVSDKSNPVLLRIPDIGLDNANVERVSISPAGAFRAFESGVIPTSPQLERVSVEGTYRPYSLTFASPHSVYGYNWTSYVNESPQDQIVASPGIIKYSYLELPGELPERVHDLANEIAGVQTLHNKVESIAQYLQREYTYGVAMDGSEPFRTPEGQDPVDWFLFDSRIGDSRSFSSAFVVLARAAGVPARIVSGWAIKQSTATQTVYLSQMHQWAEVALEDTGWTTIDPTPGNGLETAQPIYPPEEAPVTDSDEDPQQDDSNLEPALEALFGSENLVERLEAVQQLAEIDNETAWQALTYVALHDEDAGIRDAALEALELEWNVDLWIKVLQGHWEPDMRELAAETLGDLGDLKATSPLAQALIEDEEPAVRKAAADALALLGDLAAVAPLILALLSDDDPDVRIAAARALAILGDLAAVASLAQALLSDDDPEVRIAAANALRELGDEAAIAPLVYALSSDGDPNVRIVAIGALKTLGGQEVIEHLVLALLSYSEPTVRIAAANALAELGGQEAVAPLARALSADDESDVRKVAAIALGTIGDSNARPSLVEALQLDEEPEVRLAAGWALRNLTPVKSGPFIQALHNDPDYRVRLMAVAALGAIKDNFTLVDIYNAMVGDVSAEVRPYAESALQKWNRTYLEEAVIGDYDSATRALAATLLGDRGEILSVPILGEGLNDSDELVRAASLRALKKMGDITWLENGGGVIAGSDNGLAFLPGTTTLSATPAAHEPVFEVENAGHAELLRSGVGSVYEDGRWTSRDSTEWILHSRTAEVSHGGAVGIQMLNALPLNDHIQVYPAGEFEEFLPGILPTSPYLRGVSLTGQFNAENGIFRSSFLNAGYNWDSSVPEFSEARLKNASVNYDSAYVSLPPRFPERIFTLAERITADQSTPYDKAIAIQEYLQAEYVYRKPNSQDDQKPPDDWDPVAWFLFQNREGTSGNFSSAFVVLARTLGIPARVVSGWAIAPTNGRQTVYADQAHQWAEIALDGFGWVAFDPTPGGAPSRVTASGSSFVEGGDDLPSGLLELVNSLTHADQAVRDQALAQLEELAAEALLREGNGGGVARWTQILKLVQSLANVDPALRERALAALTNLVVRGPQAIDEDWAEVLELLKSLVDVDPTVQAWAAGALEKLLDSASSGSSNAEIRDQILQATRSLNAADVAIRDRAIRALNKLFSDASFLGNGGGGGGVVLEWGQLQGLLQTLSDSDPAVRGQALDALENLADSVTMRSEEEKDWNQLNNLVGSLSDPDPSVREKALDALEGLGNVVRLENGGAIVGEGGEQGWLTGTTTRRASKPPSNPLFNLTGARNTSYLRVAVGDVYENGRWRQLDPVSISYSSDEDISTEVLEEISSESSEFAFLSDSRRNPELLFGFQTNPSRVLTDRIQVRPFDNNVQIPPGTAFTSLTLENVNREGTYYPFSATFFAQEPASTYSWRSSVPVYSSRQLNAAEGVDDPTYTQLPADLPDRIRRLALQITAGQNSTFSKAQALESYLSSRYKYSFAERSSQGPPSGRDPVDWFLFDHRKGTCGVFSSAFVVLARSIGIPARVVSGWAIQPSAERQTVYTDQAHQWAEVALEGIGWVDFEPTASNGAPSRISGRRSNTQGGTGPRTPVPQNTVTNITQWTDMVQRQAPFLVGGTVRTRTGRPVSGMTVQIFVNETKEHGGIKLGETVTSQGRFQAEVQLPLHMELGPYQLLARAVGNEQYNESWSDPDVGVFSSSGLALAGPKEIPVDVEATFEGRLTEDTGEGRAGEELTVTIDGEGMPSVVTDTEGNFVIASTFSDPGDHWVEVSFEGEEFLLETTARLYFKVTLPTNLFVSAPVRVTVGQEFRISGELHDIRANALVGEAVTLQIGDEPIQSVQTGSSGDFETSSSVMTAGDFDILAEFQGDDIVLSSVGLTRLTASHEVVVAITGPSRIEQGNGATFTGKLTSGTLSDVGQLSMVLEDSSGQQITTVTTAADGIFEYSHPSFDNAGSESIKARFLGGDYILPAEASIAFAVLAPTSLIVKGPSKIEQGEGGTFQGSISSDTLSPIGQLDIILEDFTGQEITTVTTAADGTFQYSHPSFDDAGPQSITFRFLGDEFISSAETSIAFVVLAPTSLTFRGPAQIEQGKGGTFQGSISSDTLSPIGQLELVLEDSSGEQITTVTTDEDGAYEYSHPSFEDAGPESITARFLGDEFISSAETGFAFAVLAPTSLTIRGPSQIEQGMGGAFLGSISSDTLSPIGQLGLVLEDSSGKQIATVTTDEDGAYEYNHPSFKDAGPESITARFLGDEFISAAEASIAFVVQAPTSLTVEGPTLVREGEPFDISGTLLRGDGQPIANAEIVTSRQEQPFLTTDAEGRFGWEIVTVPEDEVEDGSVESELEFKVTFDGTDNLAAASAELRVAVGIPRIVVEPIDSVARGDTLTLRGSVLLGTRAMPGLEVDISQNGTAQTNEAGEFIHSYVIPADASLGNEEIEISESSLSVQATVPVTIKSASNFIVVPLDKVRPGRLVRLNATLLDDQGSGIPHATIRSSQGVEAITDEQGVALLELTVPEAEDLLAVPVTFRFNGDSSNIPLTYFLGIPVTPVGFNWLLWVGLPALALVVAAAGYSARRVRVDVLREFVLRMVPASKPISEPPPIPDPNVLLEEEEETPAPQPTHLALRFKKASPDLPDVWGVGEEVSMEFHLADGDGCDLVSELVQISVGEEQQTLITTDEKGRADLAWTGHGPLDCVVKSEFTGDDERLPAVTFGSFRVVEFREEIVRLYNVFTKWAEPRISEFSKQLTPREVESKIIAEGLHVDEKALDQLISRFEEADYSEHPIARRHYEAMYRAWRTIVES